MQRRDFFKVSASAAAAIGLSYTLSESAEAADVAATPMNAGKSGATLTKNWGDNPFEHCTTYSPDFADKNLWIRKDNLPLATYRTNPNQKYPYIYPLAGPRSMVSVVSESAMPWPHHRGMFCVGLDRVNGGNYWQQTRNDGQILSQGLNVESAEASKIVWTDSALWKKPDQDPIMSDVRKYTIDWRSDDYYVVDFEYAMTPLTEVTVQHTNHGFFGVRVSPELAPNGGGNLVNSNGQKGQAETEGKAANWVAYYGARRFNTSLTEGVAVMCAPESDWADWPFEGPCPWFTRDYGNISPQPFNYLPGPFVFQKDKAYKMNWRTVVFAGTPADVDLNGLWDEYYKK